MNVTLPKIPNLIGYIVIRWMFSLVINSFMNPVPKQSNNRLSPCVPGDYRLLSNLPKYQEQASSICIYTNLLLHSVWKQCLPSHLPTVFHNHQA